MPKRFRIEQEWYKCFGYVLNQPALLPGRTTACTGRPPGALEWKFHRRADDKKEQADNKKNAKGDIEGVRLSMSPPFTIS